MWLAKQPALLQLELVSSRAPAAAGGAGAVGASEEEKQPADVDMTLEEQKPGVPAGDAASRRLSAGGGVLRTPVRASASARASSSGKKPSSATSIASIRRTPPSSLARITPPQSRVPSPQRPASASAIAPPTILADVNHDPDQPTRVLFATHTSSNKKKRIALKRKVADHTHTTLPTDSLAPLDDAASPAKRPRVSAPLADDDEEQQIENEVKPLRKIVKTIKKKRGAKRR